MDFTHAPGILRNGGFNSPQRYPGKRSGLSGTGCGHEDISLFDLPGDVGKSKSASHLWWPQVCILECTPLPFTLGEFGLPGQPKEVFQMRNESDDMKEIGEENESG
jgi:hypothetical protein